MESLKTYTAITYDSTEGHAIRYVQLPHGLDAAKKLFASQLKVDSHSPRSGTHTRSLIAIIPGQHDVGLGDADARTRHPEKMVF